MNGKKSKADRASTERKARGCAEVAETLREVVTLISTATTMRQIADGGGGAKITIDGKSRMAGPAELVGVATDQEERAAKAFMGLVGRIALGAYEVKHAGPRVQVVGAVPAELLRPKG